MGTLPGLIIIGAGGFGREVLAWAEQSVQLGREWTIKGFIDDNPEALAGKRAPAPLLGRIADWQPAADEVFVCAVGAPEAKRQCAELIAARGGRFARLFHRTAVVAHETNLGDGVILCPHAVISPQARLGRGVAINYHSNVAHDAEVGDWSQVNGHCDLTGGVWVGREVWFSTHAAVAPGVRVGDGAYIGAGAIVIEDVEPGTRVFGVPAERFG
ncbi:MAG: acetyltransferase [Opitutaceae bacterium]|nr:acetyltransferase [Opitutaceae bacterium]